MKVKKSNSLRFAAQAICAIVVILVFGNFCRLRYVAWPCLYKEYLSGVIALVPVFLNIYLFFPLFYQKNKNAIYLLFTCLSVLLACFAEMWMVYSQIHAVAMYHSSADLAAYSVFFDGLYVLLRDISFVCFAFLIQVLRENKRHLLEMEIQVLTSHNQIQAQMGEYVSVENIEQSLPDQVQNQTDDAENSHDGLTSSAIKHLQGKTFDKKGVVLLDVDEILYFQQDHNYTYLYVTDGQRYFRYGSLYEVMGLLTGTKGVQISRNTFVLYRYVDRYDKETVCLRNPLTNNEISLSVSSYYAESAQSSLSEYFHNRVEKTRKHTRAFSDIVPDKKRKQVGSIYSFIESHPGCSAVEIKKHKHLSISTIQRIIVWLKQQEMVEYQGSKRSGGYYVIQKQKESHSDTTTGPEAPIPPKSVILN